MIGSYELDLNYVWNEPDHEVWTRGHTPQLSSQCGVLFQ